MSVSKNLKKTKKCCGCGKRPVFSVHSIYCHDCARLAIRMKVRRFPPEAEEAVWNYIRKYGYRCHYTKMLLEMGNIKSPWFCVFDHLIPLDPRTIVLTSALINEMKTALSEREFWFYVEQLDDFKRLGKKIKKIRLAYWRRRLLQSQMDARLKHSGMTFLSDLPGKKPKWPHPKDKKCDICGRPVFTLRSKYCLRCSRFNHRMEIKGFPSQAIEAIREHLRTNGYICQLTGMKLEMDNDRSPWYGVFHYLVPGDRSTVVLTCALFAEMKSDLTLKEFWYFIRQLANYKRYHLKVKKKQPQHWYRLTLKELRLKSLLD